MKDLTALGLIDSLGWRDVDFLHMPSGVATPPSATQP
jgi:hypothetical protein